MICEIRAVSIEPLFKAIARKEEGSSSFSVLRLAEKACQNLCAVILRKNITFAKIGKSVVVMLTFGENKISIDGVIVVDILKAHIEIIAREDLFLIFELTSPTAGGDRPDDFG